MRVFKVCRVTKWSNKVEFWQNSLKNAPQFMIFLSNYTWAANNKIKGKMKAQTPNVEKLITRNS